LLLRIATAFISIYEIHPMASIMPHQHCNADTISRPYFGRDAAEPLKLSKALIIGQYLLDIP
jgi:hypothetical protein